MIYEDDYKDLFYEFLMEVEKQKIEEIKKKFFKNKEEIIKNKKEQLEKKYYDYFKYEEIVVFCNKCEEEIAQIEINSGKIIDVLVISIPFSGNGENLNISPSSSIWIKPKLKVDAKKKRVSYYLHIDKDMKNNPKKARKKINNNNKIISEMVLRLNNDLSNMNNQIKEFIIKSIEKIKEENNENNKFLEDLKKNK